jgi:glycerate kinase
MLRALDSGLQSMRAGFDRLDRAAGRLARDGAAGDLAGDLVDLTQAHVEVGAGVAVVRATDEMVGTLLDVLV